WPARSVAGWGDGDALRLLHPPVHREVRAVSPRELSGPGGQEPSRLALALGPALLARSSRPTPSAEPRRRHRRRQPADPRDPSRADRSVRAPARGALAAALERDGDGAGCRARSAAARDR